MRQIAVRDSEKIYTIEITESELQLFIALTGGLRENRHALPCENPYKTLRDMTDVQKFYVFGELIDIARHSDT